MKVISAEQQVTTAAWIFASHKHQLSDYPVCSWSLHVSAACETWTSRRLCCLYLCVILSVYVVLHGCHLSPIAGLLQAAQERAASRQSGQIVRRKVHGAATKLVMMYINIESQTQKQQRAVRL